MRNIDAFIDAVPFATALLIGMMAFMEIGRRAGVRKLVREPGSGKSDLSVVEGTIFALYGLLIAFTFSGAPARLDVRRQQIAEEANDIGTAYMRLDLLAAESQPPLRALFREYLDSRLATYSKMPDLEAAKAELSNSSRLQNEIWVRAVAATRLPGAHPESARLLLPAVNDMIDITTTRLMAARIHPPLMIFGLLFVLSLFCSALAGYAMAGSGKRSWFHMLAFTAMTVITVFVILEIEYPRHGLFRMSGYDQMLADVRDTMK